MRRFHLQGTKLFLAANMVLQQSMSSTAFIHSRQQQRTTTTASSASSSINTNGTLLPQESASDKATAGRELIRLQKAVSREKRINTLEETPSLTSPEQKELDGLYQAGLHYEEQYMKDNFSDEHIAFKAMHNRAFCQLVQYCQSNTANKCNVFYLDGPDAATSQALLEQGHELAHCYVPNRHKSSCDALTAWGLPNVEFASATEALQETWANVEFAAYYFDGCGGFCPILVEMMEAAFGNSNASPSGAAAAASAPRCHTAPIAVGFSILGGNRNVVDKEKHVIQQLVQLAKRHDMVVHHVLDDPERYGVSLDTNKIDGGTLTTWCILEADTRPI